jgi:Xaa-Pro aminopeptidase
MNAPHARRRAALAAVLAETDVDAYLVTSAVNVTYLSGVVSSNAACLVSADGSTVVATDNRYAEAAAASLPDAEVLTDRAVASALVARAATTGGRLAIERHHVTLAVAAGIEAAAGERLSLVDGKGAVEALRAHKEPEEVALVEQACAVSVRALDDLLAGALLGRSEQEIARDLEARMLLLGADGLAFDTIVASGPNGSVPHHSPGSRVVERGDLLTIDFGARVGGYHADCTRTVLVAGPGEGWQREVYEVVRTAQRAGVEALAPGRSVAEVDAAARDVIAEHGYAEFFVHGLGHGVGLEIHEPPWLTGGPTSTGTLPGRTTVTVEPGIYIPGRGGVRIEDTTDVGPDGVRVLTDVPTDLLVVDG